MSPEHGPPTCPCWGWGVGGICLCVFAGGAPQSWESKIKKFMTQGSFIFPGISKRWLLITQLAHIPSRPQAHLRPSLLPIGSFLWLGEDIYKDWNLLKKETRSSKMPLQWVKFFGGWCMCGFIFIASNCFSDLLNLLLDTSEFVWLWQAPWPPGTSFPRLHFPSGPRKLGWWYGAAGFSWRFCHLLHVSFGGHFRYWNGPFTYKFFGFLDWLPVMTSDNMRALNIFVDWALAGIVGGGLINGRIYPWICFQILKQTNQQKPNNQHVKCFFQNYLVLFSGFEWEPRNMSPGPWWH